MPGLSKTRRSCFRYLPGISRAGESLMKTIVVVPTRSRKSRALQDLVLQSVVLFFTFSAGSGSEIGSSEVVNGKILIVIGVGLIFKSNNLLK